MSSGDWKPLLNDKRRCRIFTCRDSGLCCADCKKEDCKRRCLNSPERCGQVIQREEKRTETSGQNRVQSKQTFYTAESDDNFCRNYIKRRRI